MSFELASSDPGAGPDASRSGLEALERRARHAAGTAIARARDEARPQWVALSAPGSGPRDVLAAFAGAQDDDRFYWANPGDGLAFAALGAVATREVGGADRFERAGAFARSVFERVTGAHDPYGPWLVGGFAFEDASPTSPEWRGFPAGRWVLPERMLVERDGRVVGVACARVTDGDAHEAVAASLVRRLCALLAGAEDAPGAALAGDASGTSEFHTGADHTHDAYRRSVSRALDHIAAGELEKVVLARAIRVERPDLAADADAVAPLLSALRTAYPSCVTFAVARGDATFLGASPERLLSFDGESGTVRTGALAGSAPRGGTPEEDARLARALVASPKERAEHATVVRAVRDALRLRCGELSGPESPRVWAIEGIQHLATPLEGRIDDRDRKSTGLLELGGALHPTPAVGGFPVEAARRFIREQEGLERGWYASPVGFVDARGGGELRVALRSALLRGSQVRLFAGAGIVADSEPGRELRETRLKLRSLLVPLLEV
jgi:isochorismate synthase